MFSKTKKDAAEDWTCKLCKDKSGKPFENRGHRKLCFRCNVAKGSCFGSKVQRSEGGARKPALAEWQVALQRKEEALQKLRKQQEQLKQENARLKKAAEAASSANTDMELDSLAAKESQEKHASANALQERISLVESAGQKDCLEAQRLLEEAKAQLAEAKKAEMAKKPVDEQVRRARKRVNACTRAIEETAKEDKALEEKLAELQAARDKILQRQAVEAGELEEAKRDLELVLRRHIQEPVAPAATGMDTAKLFDAVQDIVELVATKAGVDGSDPAAKLFIEQFKFIRGCWYNIEQQEAARGNAAAGSGEETQQIQVPPQQQPLDTTKTGGSSEHSLQQRMTLSRSTGSRFLDPDSMDQGQFSSILSQVSSVFTQMFVHFTYHRRFYSTYYHIWTYNPRFYSLYYHIWTYNPRCYSPYYHMDV